MTQRNDNNGSRDSHFASFTCVGQQKLLFNDSPGSPGFSQYAWTFSASDFSAANGPVAFPSAFQQFQKLQWHYQMFEEVQLAHVHVKFTPRWTEYIAQQPIVTEVPSSIAQPFLTYASPDAVDSAQQINSWTNVKQMVWIRDKNDGRTSGGTFSPFTFDQFTQALSLTNKIMHSSCSHAAFDVVPAAGDITWANQTQGANVGHGQAPPGSQQNDIRQNNIPLTGDIAIDKPWTATKAQDSSGGNFLNVFNATQGLKLLIWDPYLPTNNTGSTYAIGLVQMWYTFNFRGKDYLPIMQAFTLSTPTEEELKKKHEYQLRIGQHNPNKTPEPPVKFIKGPTPSPASPPVPETPVSSPQNPLLELYKKRRTQ